MFVIACKITLRFFGVRLFATLKSGQLWRKFLDVVVPAWSAGTQVHMDVSGRILRAWMLAIHAGMTDAVP